MADIYSTVSVVAFLLAGGLFAGTLILFFTLKVKEAWQELSGQTDRKWLAGSRQSSNTKKPQPEKEKRTEKLEIEDEAATTLENGEEVETELLIDVYEPGTDMIEEELTEERTEMETEQISSETFAVYRKEIYIHSSERV